MAAATTTTSNCTATMRIEELPHCTFAVMVHRLYEDRVRDAMLFGYGGGGWNRLASFSDSNITGENQLLSSSSRHSYKELHRGKSCQVVPTQNETGVRKARRGYVLLILENCSKEDCLRQLSPLARQNISWGVPLSHKCESNHETCKSELGRHLWSFLLHEVGFCVSKHTLRVDTHPKEEGSCICYALQVAGASKSNHQTTGATPQKVDCYEGPVSMTKSTSKSTHLLTVICVTDSCFWGVLDRTTHTAVSLNHDAAQEVRVESTHPNSGMDLSSSSMIPVHVPVSRAYYKLTQAWDEILSKQNLLASCGTFGLDIGSAPGGWTQVLSQHIGLSRVLSVDPGCLANRVSSLEGVEHVFSDMASTQTAAAISGMGAQCSMLVCDASLDSHLVLDKIIALLEQLPMTMWPCPAVFVITLKLPYKTKASIERNLSKVTQTVPSQLQRIAKLMYPTEVEIRYQIFHLMANSDSERTLVVAFDKLVT